MNNFDKKNPYMDYRNTVPFMNLAGFVCNQKTVLDETPAKSLKEQLLRKKFSSMINLRRLVYRCRVEGYKYGRR